MEEMEAFSPKSCFFFPPNDPYILHELEDKKFINNMTAISGKRFYIFSTCSFIYLNIDSNKSYVFMWKNEFIAVWIIWVPHLKYNVPWPY